MLPIVTFESGEKILIEENTVIITNYNGWSMLYLKMENLTVRAHPNPSGDQDLTNKIWCTDNSSFGTITIIFDRDLTLQEIAEELSRKFEYNVDRICAAIAANISSIELALVPKSKRAV